jgi:hypothetical protein
VEQLVPFQVLVGQQYLLLVVEKVHLVTQELVELTVVLVVVEQVVKLTKLQL